LYTYDANGNVATIVDQRSTAPDGWFNRTMAYDDLDRLAGVTAPGVWTNATYLYDPVDDLRSVSIGTRSSTLTYNAATKRLDSIVTNGVSTAYAYDGNGNISTKGSQTYVFDLGNRMVSASLGGSYSYDGHGRRTKIVNSDGTTQMQLYSQAGQLLWSEKTAVSTGGTFPATATYSCSTGTLSGTNCVTTNTYTATTALSCAPGDSRNGSTCTHTTSYVASASYSCPSGGTLSGSSCSRNDNYTATVSLACDTGDTRSGGTCTHSTTYTATTTYSCDSGDALTGSTCNHTNYVPASVSYSCASGTLNGATCAISTSVPATSSATCNGAGTINADGYCEGAGVGVLSFTPDDAWDACMTVAGSYGLSLETIKFMSGKSYRCILQPAMVYTCPNGGTLSGAQCNGTSSQPATPTYKCGAVVIPGTQCPVAANYTATSTYSCPSGGSRIGTTCTQTNTYSATSSSTCPSGGTLSGSTCLKTTNYGAAVAYSCPSGGSLNGSTCSQTNTYAATSAYSCTAGDTLNGSTCAHSTAVAAAVVYSCPNGGTLSGTNCSGSNTTSTAYIYLGGKQIAETVVGGITQYVHTDALGSPVAHTNQAAAELNRTRFEPYGFTAGGTKPGVTATGLSTTGSAIGFTGHVNDPQTDLVYMQQRYYDPIAGRFLSRDPVMTQANTGGNFNRYAYAKNNPYSYVDRDGRWATWIHRRVTVNAALQAGMSKDAAAELGEEVVNVDKGTQTGNSYDTNVHMMAGENPDGSMQTAEEAVEASNALVSNTNTPRAKRIHAAQDGTAPHHLGKTWHDPATFRGKSPLQIIKDLVEAVEHLLKDVFISHEQEAEATEATKKIIEENVEKAKTTL
jgi:RHS repeat-associated protein